MRRCGVHTSGGSRAILLCLFVLSGCASGHPAGLSNRLIRQGEPSVNLGGPPLATKAERPHATKAIQPSKPPESHRTAASGATVEGANGRLAAALLAEALVPSVASHLRVAEEYKRLGVLDAAYAALTRALRDEPSLAIAHEGLARVWRDWGMPEQGLGPAYRATYYDRRSASAQNTLGTILDALERPELAREAFERALAIEPTASWALNNLCYVDYRLGDLERARSECAEALRLKPGFAAVSNNMALVLAADGDLVGARQSFRAAGDEAAADFNLGIVLLQDGEYAAAAGAFEDAIKARPDFTAAKTRAHQARVRMITGRN